jgi:MFS family permease
MRLNYVYAYAPMLITTNLYAALGDRWGRKALIFIFLTGALIYNFMWIIVVSAESGWFRDHWRGVMGFANFLTGAFGGYPLAYYCTISLVADYTRFQPQHRELLFAVQQGILAVANIFGSQMAGFGPTTTYPFTFSFLVVLTIIIAVCLPDTTPPEVRDRKINWWRANALGALMVLFPLASTEKLHAADSHQMYDDMCEVTYRASDAGRPNDVNNAYSRFNGADSLDALSNRQQHQQNQQAAQGGPSAAAIAAAAAAVPVGVDGINPYVFAAGSPAAQRLITAGIALPTPPAAQRNALGVLAITLAFTVVAGAGLGANFVPVMKQNYTSPDRELSVLITLESLFRTIGTFIFVPLVAKLAYTRWHQLQVMQLFFIIVGICVWTYRACYKVWHVQFVMIVQAFFMVVPAGFIRGLMSSQVGVLMQAHILAAMTAIELFGGLAGNVIFTSIFVTTNDTAATTYFIPGSLLFIAASLFPFFVHDTKESFNSRRAVEIASEAPKAAVEMETTAAEPVGVLVAH